MFHVNFCSWIFKFGCLLDSQNNFYGGVYSLLNTFTANYKLSCSPGFLYFCQLWDNSYFRDPLFLPTTSYLVVTKFIIFANYEITRTTLFLIFHLFTQKRMDFIIFVGKLKTQRILIRVFQTFLKKHFLYCHATRYLVVQNMGSLKSAW